MSTEIIYNTYDNEVSIVHDDIVNDKVLKVVTAPFGNSNTKDVLEYPLAENLLEVQSYGFSQFIKTSFLVRKAEVILNIDDEDIVVAEAENIEMNHWYRLEGFFTMDELKKVDFNNATLRLRITKAFNDPEVYIYRPCLTKGDTIPDWFPSLEEIMGDIIGAQSLISVGRRLENLVSDLDESEQDEIKIKLNISDDGELKKIGDGYGLQDQIDNPDNYGTLGYNAVNLSYSDEEGDFGATHYESHAVGYLTTASGSASHAEGDSTIASGTASHAEGAFTTASSEASHAEGNNTIASGNGSHAEGGATIASGQYSHAEGAYTTAGSYAENARGFFNEIIPPISATSFNANDVIESVGVGTNSLNRKNALTRWKNGAFKWLLQSLTNITNAVKGFHAADEDGRLNYHDGTEWKKYLLEGEEGEEVDLSNYYNQQEVDGLLDEKLDIGDGGELKKIGNGYGLQHQIDNPNNYGNLGNNAVNLSYSLATGNYGASGYGSHAEGFNTTASGDGSHAEGSNTIAGSYGENARGIYNEEITPISAINFNSNDVIESVGIGSYSQRKNALTRWKNGAFKWLLQPLTNITNAVLGFHAADEDGRLNYHNGTEWKKYVLEGELDDLKAKLDLLVPPPTYTQPTATISLTNRTYEVGTTLNDSMTVTFNKNDAGDVEGFKVYKNGVEVSNTNSYTETSVIGKEVLTFRGEVSYEAGELKDNIFGEPDDRGAIQGGSVTTPNRTIRGEYKIFFGAGGEVIDYRNLPQEDFESSNNLILETGTTLKEFYVAVPDSRELISVVDLDALNAELVSQYVEAAVQVNDAAGNPTDYKLYMMTIDTPYSTNHRHRLTFN